MQLSFGYPTLAILKGITFTQSIGQMPGINGGLKHRELGAQRQKHRQAPAAVGSSSLAQLPKDAQGARSRTTVQLQVPMAHPTAPATRPPAHPMKYCCLGHKTSCKQQSERERNCKASGTKQRGRRSIMESLQKGEKHNKKIRFLWEAQSRTLFSKAPLRKPRQRTSYKSKSSH